MQTTKIKQFSTTVLASLLVLSGCTNSQIPLKEKKENTPSASPQILQENVSTSNAASRDQHVMMADKEYPAEAVAPVSAKLAAQPAAEYRERVTASQIGYVHRRDSPALPIFKTSQRESYDSRIENSFISTTNDPLSTFSIDVDTASYSNIRRFVQNGSLPPVGAVRIEEMINYFSYTYPEPRSEPFSISAEIGPCPWQDENRLVSISIKAQDVDESQLPPSNLVFLIDVSGSMNQENKLPLLKKSLLMLTDKLDSKDRIAIIVYAGSDRIALMPTPGNRKEAIKQAIDKLTSGGSTHASSGINTAYDLARQSYMPSGNNRIILASDGDFNVGTTSRGELERLISEKKESGVYLTVLGFGMGNFHDDTMEILADKGNGNYAYIDSLLEAKKVLIKERTSTLFALANDVKLQIEFNPAAVGSYRLLGYENRALADEDFNNDKKDAGEIGVGHTVTALYEIIPAGAKTIPVVDPLKYQKMVTANSLPDEILTVKLRYKPIGSKQSLLLTRVLHDKDRTLDQTSADFRFAAAVAGYGLLLQHSEYSGTASYSDLIKLARGARGSDAEGYRAEFIRLLEMSEMMTP